MIPHYVLDAAKRLAEMATDSADGTVEMDHLDYMAMALVSGYLLAKSESEE